MERFDIHANRKFGWLSKIMCTFCTRGKICNQLKSKICCFMRTVIKLVLFLKILFPEPSTVPDID